MFNKYILNILILVGIAKCEIDVGFRIVGGVPAAIRDFPYQVSLQYDWFNSGSYSHLCGGTLIRSSVVLTAAHCVYDNSGKLLEPRRLLIMAGNNILNATIDVQRIGASQIIPHENYKSNFDNDIALIHTVGNFSMKETVKLIPYRRIATHTGENCTVSGWGKLSETLSSPLQLMRVDVPIVDHNQCKIAYSTLTQNMICAGEKQGGKDACQGDSGGPLVCGGEVAGIVSFGVGCARPNFPGVYANVGQYAQWIDYKSSSTLFHPFVLVIFVMNYLLIDFFPNIY